MDEKALREMLRSIIREEVGKVAPSVELVAEPEDKTLKAWDGSDIAEGDCTALFAEVLHGLNGTIPTLPAHGDHHINDAIVTAKRIDALTAWMRAAAKK